MKRFLLLLAMFIPMNTGAQSVSDFPQIQSIGTVTITGQFLYFDLDPVIPQAQFRSWWAEMEECTGISKPYDEIRWHVADAIWNIIDGFSAWGMYYLVPAEIIIVRNQTLEQLEHTVKHETLHHLVQNTDHDEETFVRCLPQTPNHRWKPF